MDDLISRSALKQEIESLQMVVTGLRAGKGVLSEFMKQYRESVLKIIDEQPTAYNVDKVVEQIENARQKYQRLCKEQGQKEDEAMNIHFRGMMNIVKAGGVNG